MKASLSEAGLSPLDQIRQVEAEVTRRVAVAREAAEKSLLKARTQAANCKSQAQAAGQLEGQARHKEIIAKADEEAQAYITQMQRQAANLRARGTLYMEQAIEFAVQTIIGNDHKAADAEPVLKPRKKSGAPVPVNERSGP